MPTHGVGSLRRLPRAIAITVGWPSSEISGTCREFDPQRAWAHLTPGSMALPRGGGFARSRAPLALLREEPAHNATYDSPSLTPYPAICVSTATSTYVPICARSPVATSVVLARHSVRV